MPTLPKLLRQAGYATAHVGKWHLGGLNKEQAEDRAASIPEPLEHGFDHYLAMYEDRRRGTLLQTRRLYRDGGQHPVRNDRPVEPVARHWTDYKITEIARNGRWKLSANDGEPTELFDLDADPCETTDLLTREPEIVRRLTGELQAWLREPRHSWKTE